MVIGILLWFVWMTPQQGDYHYIDGTELLLTNGVLIRTATEITEDRKFYSWEEDGVRVNVTRERVRSIRYFSMRVRGKDPRRNAKSAVMRRINGNPVSYMRDGELYFRVRHVDARGRSAEARPVPNRVKALKRTTQNQETQTLAATLSQHKAGTTVTFRFYDLKGRLRAQAFLQADELDRSKKGSVTGSLQVSGEVNLERIGLVEITSN